MNFRSDLTAKPIYRNGEKIAVKCYVAQTLFQRLRGLLGSSPLSPEEALLIPQCNSVHTFFMRYSIDICFLSRDFSVLKTLSSVPPWRITGIVFRAYYTLETAAGWIHSHHLKAGDVLSYE